ncbi:MAG: DUF1579 family protein [Rhodothermaceae bacterium]|nr:DUF1579 family protein [Rhodothermaceae bacterium]
MSRLLLALLALAVLTPLPGRTLHAQSATDGRLFDQGRTMTERSPRADATLDQMKALLGQWDVAVTTHPTDSTTHEAQGHAEITYMNRGYAYQERRRVPGYDEAGRETDVMAFLVFTPAVQEWALGEVSTYTEHVELYNGDPRTDDRLVLSTSVRRRGGTRLIHYRVTYTITSAEAFTVVMDRSVDDEPWVVLEERRYTRRAPSADFMAVREDWGAPAPGLPEAARQFDFLIGTWGAAHRINLGGNWIQYPSTTTASYVLGGRGILEYSWFNTDPNLPDAATSILRIYNRVERRWESLYLTNRGNALLDFGGVWEGDRMVLHLFDTNLTDPVTRFVFHAIEPDRYQWFAETSRDRGESFTTTWTIDITRQ